MEFLEIASEGWNLRHSITVKINAVTEGILTECLLYAGIHYLEYDTVLFKLYFSLCRMNIHVN